MNRGIGGMKYILLIETELDGITPSELVEVINYELNFKGTISVEASDIADLISKHNTRIVSCEVAPENNVPPSDYVMD